MNNKLKPAIIGGVVLGILSIIPVVNLCCCLWAILGGLLASQQYVKSSPAPASTGDGAIVGALAGLVGAVIVVIIGIPLSILTSGIMAGLLVSLIEGVDPSQVGSIRAQLEAQSVAGHIVNGFIFAVLVVVFSTLGGLIGIPIFEKRTGSTPPPPQNYGGPGGPGGYGAGV